MSPYKTKMGRLDTFHFLDVNFTIPGNSPKERGYKKHQEKKREANPIQDSKDSSTNDQTQEGTAQQNNQQISNICSAPYLFPSPTAVFAGGEVRRGVLFAGFYSHSKSHPIDPPPVLPPSKTMMGGGITTTAATRIVDGKTQVTIRLHPRSCRRALDKANVMKEGAAYHPVYIQHYLSRWAIWWKSATESICPVLTNLTDWVTQAKKSHSDIEWLGRGLVYSVLSPFDLQ